MKKLTAIRSVAFAAAATLAMAASAQNNVELGNPEFLGDGCLPGSASAVLSNDRQSLSILFSGYSTEAGYTTGKQFDRKACNMAIPVRVPQGISVSIFSVDYRGYNNLPRGAFSDFNVEYFFAGSRGPSFRRRFTGPINDDYIITNDLIGTAVTWSPCGREVILRANTSIRVTTNSRRDQAMATVDSTDVSAALIYRLQWRRCN
jgi:hypothetical protein